MSKRPDPNCEYCGGEGVVPVDEITIDGNWETGVGSTKCVCTLSEEDEQVI